MGLLTNLSHEFGSCLVTSSSAMTAYLFCAPRWAGAMLSKIRKLVYADDRYNDNILLFAGLKSILLFRSKSTHYEKQKKQQQKHKNNNNLQTSQTNTLLCQSFLRLSHKKSIKSMCYLKIYIKVYHMHITNHV